MKISPFFFLLFSLLLLTTCNKEESTTDPRCPDCNFTCLSDSDTDIITNDCDSATSCAFTIHSDSKLKIEDRLAMTYEAGDKKVFLLQVYSDPRDDLAGDETTIKLGFELPTDQTSFALDDDQLQNINLHSQRICFCSDIPTFKVEQGCVQGKQQTDGSWWVQGDLVIKLWMDEEVDYKFEVKFEE